MNENLVYVVGFIGSVASILGLAFYFFPKKKSGNSSRQIQSGHNNIQAGRDIIINHNGESTRGDKVFLYEEQIEMYWNEWWAHPLQSCETVKKRGQAELTITGEGKNVDFSGVISMNCSNGKYYWKTASNYQKSLTSDADIKEIVPDQVRKNIYKLFCRDL